MTGWRKRQVIDMAREAGFEQVGHDSFQEFTARIERFAALVAKHTLANIDPSSFMSWQEGYEAGKQTEREACAKVCEQGLPIASSLSALDDMEMWGEKFAAAIRAKRDKHD